MLLRNITLTEEDLAVLRELLASVAGDLGPDDPYGAELLVIVDRLRQLD